MRTLVFRLSVACAALLGTPEAGARGARAAGAGRAAGGAGRARGLGQQLSTDPYPTGVAVSDEAMASPRIARPLPRRMELHPPALRGLNRVIIP